MKRLQLFTYTCLCLLALSCQKFMDPAPDNYLSDNYVMQSRDAFQGILYNTYKGLPTRVSFIYEAATDNSITNQDTTVSSKLAKGGLSKVSNPLGDNVWQDDYKNINIANWCIEQLVLDFKKPIPTTVKFDINPVVNLQMFYFLLGEAYFIRAWYQFDLLQKYGGVAEDGKAYGFPISTKYINANVPIIISRSSYRQCAEQIAADCDSAAKYLPIIYSKASVAIPQGPVSLSGHASGMAAKALKARTYLYAASPAYNSDPLMWQKAAQAAADAISAIGPDDLLSYSVYFNKANVNNNNYSNKDIFFRGPIQSNLTTYESENFPPRAFSGRGFINPSQNLVDAFPMSDGFPRGVSPNKTYDPSNVVLNRDPRLDLFVVCDGESFAGLTKVQTQKGGSDAFGSDPNSTRTGYYLQKFLDPTVRLETNKVVSTSYACILLGRPELYLNFAEAVLEATGNPDSKQYNFSAREMLAKIRDRALGKGNDKYLSSVTGLESFRTLVRNERRIELCFENHRFWDVRRWSNGKADLSIVNQAIYGIYSTSPIQTLSFKSPYMPLPYGEVIKSNLVNNAGW